LGWILWRDGKDVDIMNHSIEVIKVVETDLRQGILTFKCGLNEYNAFYWGYEFRAGEKRDVSFQQLSTSLKWETIFGENKNQKIEIKKDDSNEASYYCFGKIESLNPIIANFGDLKLDLGDWTHDERVIGSFIYWKIHRLVIAFPE
jgi:hypothetical protein